MIGADAVPDTARRSNRRAPELSFGEFLSGLWAVACDALAIPGDQADRSASALRAVLPAWADERIGITPAQPSYVGDDGFPAEMSVNWSRPSPELRVLFDCLDDARGLLPPPGPEDAGAGLAAVPPSFGQVHEIFTTQARSPAPLWRSISWCSPSTVLHKTYYGLFDWPTAQRYAAVGEAMDRLGLATVWDSARRRVEGGEGLREIEFLALDLVDEARARVKVYYRNHGADIAELDRIASVVPSHDADGALAAYRTLTGNGSAAGDAALSCLAFRIGQSHACECATYLRMPCLTSNNREAVDRTAAVMRDEGVAPERFRALASALTPEQLAGSQGLLTLVSHRAGGRPGDITTYFRFPVYHR